MHALRVRLPSKLYGKISGLGLGTHANRMACRVNFYIVSGYEEKGEDRTVDYRSVSRVPYKGV